MQSTLHQHDPTEPEKRLVRQNLKAAADELGIALDFRPIKDTSRMHVRIISPEEKAALPPRGGRPKKGQPQPEAIQETVEEAPPETNGTEPGAAPPARSRRRRNQPQEATLQSDGYSHSINL